MSHLVQTPNTERNAAAESKAENCSKDPGQGTWFRVCLGGDELLAVGAGHSYWLVTIVHLGDSLKLVSWRGIHLFWCSVLMCKYCFLYIFTVSLKDLFKLTLHKIDTH